MSTQAVTVDFGSIPVDNSTFLVSGLSGLTSASYVEAFLMKESTSDNSVDEHEMASIFCKIICEYVSATSLNIIVHCMAYVTGTFKIRLVTL